MTTFASSEPGRHDPVPGSWIEDRESPERRLGERRPANSARWGGWIKKAGAVGMIVWALSGVGRDNALPAHEPGPRANHATGAAAVELEPTSPADRTAAHKRLAEARRAELDTVLDSMLISQHIKPGTPFEERSGHIPDERVRNIVKKIDDRLGGRIEWPNIHLVDGLRENERANGQHQAYKAVGGETAPRAINDPRKPAEKFGIRLDKQLVEDEFRTGEPGTISIESLLVHEVQHATSNDHETELRAKEAATGDALVALPYEDIADAAMSMTPVYGQTPTAESRADLAMVLHRELEQREKLGGPRLNEMPDDERRAAMSGILIRYVENHHDRNRNEGELLGALKDPKYIHDQGTNERLPNPIWEPDTNAHHTVEWAHGHDVPGHRPRDSSLIEQLDSLGTNLPGMAERWTSGASHQPGMGNPAEMAMPIEELEEQVAAKLKKIDEQVARAAGPPKPQTETRYVAHGLNPDNPPTAETLGSTPAADDEHDNALTRMTPEERHGKFSDLMEKMAEETERIQALWKERSREPALSENAPRTAGQVDPGTTERPVEQPDGTTAPNVQSDLAGTAYQGHTIERRNNADPRETGLLADESYQEKIGVELDAILDSMLVTNRVPPGTPFEERVGAIPNEHIRALMKDIDDNLGGRIEWPNIQIADELSVPHALAQYRAYIGANGATVPENVNLEAPADEKFGISIRRDVYESGIGEAPPSAVSLRSALVHELQHATSSDNVDTLQEIARDNGWPYIKGRHAMAEGRADLAVLLDREIEARHSAGGPQLNDMAPEERREAISQILGGYLGAKPDEPEHVRDAKLLLALRDPAYVASPDNLMWQRNGDDRTVDYIYGRDQSGNFVPSHNTPEEREQDLRKPLNELAAEWRNSAGTDTENRAATLDRQDRQAPQPGSGTANLQAPERNTSEKAPSAYLTTSASRPAAPAEQPAAPAERPAAPAERPAAPAERPAAPADTEPEPERKTEARHGQTHQAGRAHLKLLRHAQHHRVNEPAKTPQDRADRSSASAGEDEFAAPSGRYSSGRTRRGETTPVRGGERSVGGSPPAARQQPTAQRASTR